MSASGPLHGVGRRDPPPREICIVMLSAIGDAVHVLPVTNALKRAWPETRVTWVIQPTPHRLVAGHPAVDDFVIFRRRRGWRAWEGFQEVARSLRGRRFDLLIGLQVYFKAGLITALAEADVKLGFDRKRARDAQFLFTDQRIPAHPAQHVQDQYFEFLRHLGVDPHPVTWGLEPTEDERVAQRAFFERIDRPACAVVVATSKPEKDWSPAGYTDVLEALDRDHGFRPVLVGGPAPRERAIADRIVAETDVPVVDALGDDLRRLMWIVEGSALLVTPDTGPLHIARAVGTPVVSLFGYTNPKRSGPYRRYEDLIVDGYATHAGESYGPNSPNRPGGMRRVTVEDVLEKVALALERYPPVG